MRYTLKQIQCRPWTLSYLSVTLIESHYENNYGGALRRLNGELHHAIAAGTMARDDVHAELAEVIAGRQCGRSSADEIVVFDSTGTGLQDVAAAIAVYRRAVDRKEGNEFDIGR